MKFPLTFVFAISFAVHTSWAGPDAAKQPVSVNEKAVALTEEDAAPTVVGGGVKTTGHFTEGNAFIVQPLWDDLGQRGTMGGSLLFAEPYFSWGEEGEICASIGFGFRHLFSDQTLADGVSNTSPGLLEEGFYVGGNVFVDYMNTREDSNLWQLGVGAEAGTRYFEVRGNYYIPLGDGERVDRFDFTALEPHFRGGLVTSMTARTRTIDVIEEPMEGWDAEVALLVPGIDKWCDVRLVGGYFEFEGDNGGALFSSADIKGWKAGIEVRPVPAVVLSATWYEDEAFIEDHWLYGIRLEIPLGKPGSFTPRRRHLQERLVEPVRRQNAAVVVGVTTEQVGPTRTTKINSPAELASFVSHSAQGSSGSVIVLTSRGGGTSVSNASNTYVGSTLELSGSIGAADSAAYSGKGGTMTSLTLGGGTLETTGSGVFGQPASTVTLNGNISYVNGTGINGTTITGGAHTQIVTGTTLIINGVTLPAGIYPINNGTINLGGSIIKLGGATIVHPAASTPPP